MLEYLNYSKNFLKEFVLLKVKVILSKNKFMINFYYIDACKENYQVILEQYNHVWN